MKRKKILAANWKMNLDLQSACELANDIAKTVNRGEILNIIFPPSLFLNEIKKIVSPNSIFTGAQNCSSFESGAYTGEISAKMIKSCGADYCLIGHSERRTIFAEDEKTIYSKINRCLDAEIFPILCVGENLSQRNEEKHFETVEIQILSALKALGQKSISKIIIAYEPVWAIGTGLTATPSQAQEIHAFIRQKLIDLVGRDYAENLSIIYGGSCNSSNAQEIFSCKDVDGGLIGSASLKAEEFGKISFSFSQ
ncbi:MAG: triose-phosphate isomerase [Bacteroidota bacterium]